MLNIAHRGFTKEHPENTLEAFQAAIALGVDAIECDVQETADGELVIFHDPTILGERIDEMPLARVREIRLQRMYRAPILEEALRLCKGRTGLLLEVKQTRSLDRFLAVLRAEADLAHTAVASFNPLLLTDLARLAPDFRKGLIVDSPPPDPTTTLRRLRCEVIGVRFPHVNEELAEKLHGQGYKLFVWGCANKEEVAKALVLPIDGIVSDFPDTMKQELERRRTPL